MTFHDVGLHRYTGLLSSVIAAHGGIDRWHTVGAIDVTFNFSAGCWILRDIRVIAGLRHQWTLRHLERSFRG
jgi:hypothetical protein